MSYQANINTKTSLIAGVPPAPSEARQQASRQIKFTTSKTVYLNGSKIEMVLIDGLWVNVKVTSV